MLNLPVVCTKCGAYANLPCAYHYHECIHKERWEVPSNTEENSVIQLIHTHVDCILVALRIACPQCGYPQCEARYMSAEDFIKNHTTQNKL